MPAGAVVLGGQLTSPDVEPAYVSIVLVPYEALFAQVGRVATSASGEYAFKSSKYRAESVAGIVAVPVYPFCVRVALAFCCNRMV